MSLLDAFLLDPAPFDTWVAYRQDLLKGSGTLNDPWNGSPRYDSVVTKINPITRNQSDLREAAALALGHPYRNGDVVTINGVTGQDAARWNSTFAIYGVVDWISFNF